MVSGLVMKPKTTEQRKTMIRPTKDTTMTKHTREQMLALLQDDEAIKELLQTTIQTALEAEMDEGLDAGKGERSDGRKGYRSGHYRRRLTPPMWPDFIAFSLVITFRPRPLFFVGVVIV
jgi:hypothetical protein